MNRMLAIVLSASLLTSAGCIHAQNPNPARIAGGAMLAVGVMTAATAGPDDCESGNPFDDAGCTTVAAQSLLLGIVLATVGVILLGTQGPNTENEVAAPPPRSFYAKATADVAMTEDDNANVAAVPIAALLAAPDAKPAAVQMARTAWIAASLGRCDTVIRATALIASTDPDYFELAVATNPTIATCLTP